MDQIILLSLYFFILGGSCVELDKYESVVEQNQQLLARLQVMEDKMVTQEDTILEISKDAQQTNEDMNIKMSQYEQQKKESDYQLHDMATEIVKLRQEINNLNQVGVVAFNVRRTTDFGPMPTKTLVPHDSVDLNIGGAYEPSSDLFTAPVNGVYYFHTHHNYFNGVATLVWLDVNNAAVIEKRGGDSDYNTSSAGSITVELAAGDVVGVYLHGNDQGKISCQSQGECLFGGWLLYETIA